MEKELSYLILLPISSFLFMLGGWKWKGWRRFLLPLIFILTCLAFKVEPWRAWTLGLFALISFSLPYGENSTWKMRVFTAITFGLIGIPLGLNWMMILPPVVFLAGWIASNGKLKVQWKIIEGITGFAIALPIADMLYKI